MEMLLKLKNADKECTSYPYWMIIDPKQMMGPDIGFVASMLTGPFFNREDAENFLKNTRYNFSQRAAVFCLSGTYSTDWVALHKTAKQFDIADWTDRSQGVIEVKIDGPTENFNNKPIDPEVDALLKDLRECGAKLEEKKYLTRKGR